MMPFDLLMGYTPRLWQTKTASTIPDIMWRKEWLLVTRECAQEAMKQAQKMVMKRNTQQKGCRAYVPYKEGDLVWLDGKNLQTLHPTQKLAPKRFGPFKVIDAINPVLFRLELPLQWKQKKVHPVFHASLLSPYREMEEHGVNFPEPPPDLVEGEEEYEVEQVLGSRRHGCRKKLQYLLRWKGYSQAHDSWESADQVHAPELVDRFHRENPEAIRAIDLKEDELDEEKTMPYIHPDNGSITVSSAIAHTFFQEGGPYSPILRLGDDRPIVTLKMLLGPYYEEVLRRPSFQSPQDRGSSSNSEEEGGSSSQREVHSSYGTPNSSPSVTSEPLAVDSDGHRSDDGGGDADEIWRALLSESLSSRAGESNADQNEWWSALATMQGWGENDNWGEQAEAPSGGQLSAEQGESDEATQILNN
jgi:hypothetical protein